MNTSIPKPLVGLLYNPAVPLVVLEAGDLIEQISVIPERFWYDDSVTTPKGTRFRYIEESIDMLRYCAEGRIVSGHGIGLSLPSAVPLDDGLLAQISRFAAEFDFAWFSEHMSVFITPHGRIPNAQAGLGLPVVYDEETFGIIAEKLSLLKEALNCPLLMENGSIFTEIPELEFTEPEFFNRLYHEQNCGMLLDLHNLYVTARNGNADPAEYLNSIDPDSVLEIHMAGGDEIAGFYTDSHSRTTPDEVMEWAYEVVSRFRNLKAITFEFHESYFERLGVEGIAAELERLHALADCCAVAEVAHA